MADIPNIKTFARLKYNFQSDFIREYGVFPRVTIRKNEICKTPCNIINSFFKTWLIYSCKGRCCPYTKNNKCTLNKKSTKTSPIEYAFYSILGIDYTDSTVKNIIRRLNRFLHIILYEGRNFNESYNDTIDFKNREFKAVLNKSTDFSLALKYKNIYDYLEQNLNKDFKYLESEFNRLTEIAVERYNSIDDTKNSINTYLTKNIFFSDITEINDIREKLLVLAYIYTYRLYEIIDIDIFDSIIPENTYINTFFYPEKIFFSNEIMYIILHNKKSILIYDLNDKIPFMSDDLIITNDKLITIDELRGIYLYNFDTKIKSIYESQENVIIEFEDGTYRINGTNNHKIDNTNNLQYFIFKDYNPGDYEKIIKTYISKKYIIQLKENGKIYIHGDIENGPFDHSKCINTSDELVKLYFDEGKEYKDFYISDDDNIFIAYENPQKSIILNNAFVKYEDNILTIRNHDNEEKTVTITASKEENVLEITQLIPLSNNAIIIVCEETDGENKEYRYFTFGINTDSRLGYTCDPENIEEDENNIHEITDDICIDRKNIVNRNLRIEKVISFNNRTIILNSGNSVLACGKNNGFFCELNDLNYKNQILTKFTPIISNNDINNIYDIVSNDNEDKPLILIYNEFRVYAFGALSYRGFKNGGGYYCTDEEVESKNNNEYVFKPSKSFSLFSSQRAIFTLNPIFDILTYVYSLVTTDTQISFFDFNRFKDTLSYIKDISIKEDMIDEFKIKIKNIEDTQEITRKLSSRAISGNLSNLKSQDLNNYITNRYMISDYIEKNKYGYFGIFINFLAMIAECKKYIKIEEVNERRICSKNEFELKYDSLNFELPGDKGARIYDYTR